MENDANISEPIANCGQPLSFEKVWLMFQETDRMFKETDKKFKETDKKFEETRKIVGRVTNTLGYFVEGMVTPRILEMFKEKNIVLTEIMPNVLIHNKDGKALAEIDLLLVNTTYSVAVEVKTTLTIGNVNDHIKRLERLQANPIRAIKGTRLLGAVAGMNINPGAGEHAMQKGLFVLKQKDEIMEVANDKGFTPHEWVVKG